MHNKIELGRAGGMTYLIDFRESGASTVVTTKNLKMPTDLAAKMEFDINRWKGGATDCSKVMPEVAASAAPKEASPSAASSPPSSSYNPLAR